MAAESSWIDHADQQLSELLSGWNFYTTLLALALLVFVAYPLFVWYEPDIHPMLLARQSNPSRVRQPRESAVYRSLETPHEYPLRTGLGVRDPDTPRYGRGRDGDLRDIWNQALKGVAGPEGTSTEQRGKILTVLGKEEVVEHGFEDISREINIVGQYIRQQGADRVAVYLPNSLELLSTVFASAFHQFTPILLPYDQSKETVIKFLQSTKPDLLVAAAGVFPLSDIVAKYPGLKKVIWVVEQGSRHMDWSQDADSSNKSTGVSTWHDIIGDGKSSEASELPPRQKDDHVSGLVTIWQKSKNDPGQAVEYSQANIVAGVAALLSSLPTRQRIGPSDLFLPADSLTSIYPLTQTLAALYSNASVALNSVSGPAADLALAMRSIAPTIIVASPDSIKRTFQKDSYQKKSILTAVKYMRKSSALGEGRMPTSVLSASAPALGNAPGKLRLIYVSDPVSERPSPLSSSDLSDARIYTGARVIYALTAPAVAGAVAQTNMYDYRSQSGRPSHFGVPLSSHEIKLVDTPTHKSVEDELPKGEIVVTGPSVVSGTAALGVTGTFQDDHTLAYA
ncbi:MAG: hypothetical protein M4579_001594 [Chaenotheca gracillima]|nr:MAG: hypothetical protein M4579_001594 [Chaenotheca gracillima]